MLKVKAWYDPVVDRSGFTPQSQYVEFCWLPVLGPSATWLYRRLGMIAVLTPDGADIDMVEIAGSLGLGTGLGRNSLLAKAVTRLCRFGVARWEDDRLALRRVIAALPDRHLGRLNRIVHSVHAEEVAGRRSLGLAPASALPPLRRPVFSGYL